MPKVSVVMAVYNEMEYLSKSIKSILAQSFSDFEFIIIDDCSSDGSREVLEKFVLTDDRIRTVLNERNLGLARSLNAGIALSKGEYIARMDADDISLQNRLCAQVDFLDQNPDVSVLGANVDFIDRSGDKISASNMPNFHDKIRRQIVKRNPIIHPVVMYRRDFIESMNGYDESLRKKQDYDLWVRGVNDFKYHNLSVKLLLYRVDACKSLKTDSFGFYVRCRNAFRLKSPVAFFWAIIVFIVNILTKFGYTHQSFR